MGREAQCMCRWGNAKEQCTVLLEGPELIVRGAGKRRVPLSAITEVAIRNDELCFRVDGVDVGLAMGAKAAVRWAEAMAAPLPTLAKKLGITEGMRVLVLGEVDAEELRAALKEAESVVAEDAEDVSLVIIRASTPVQLEGLLGACWQRIDGGCAVWVIYPKGTKSTLGESMVREKMRGLGLVDVKVASVSEGLTGLKFIRRKG